MEKTAKPIIAGILNVVCGSLGLLFFFSLLVAILVTSGALDIPGTWGIPWFVSGILWSVAIPSLITGGLALAGGILALQRKAWGWALAGSIASTLFLFPVGIPAIVFTAQAREEFE